METESKAKQRWLVCPSQGEGQNRVLEMFVMEETKAGRFKAQICSGPNIGAIEWFNVSSWNFIERLNDPEGISSSEG